MNIGNDATGENYQEIKMRLIIDIITTTIGEDRKDNPSALLHVV